MTDLPLEGGAWWRVLVSHPDLRTEIERVERRGPVQRVATATPHVGPIRPVARPARRARPSKRRPETDLDRARRHVASLQRRIKRAHDADQKETARRLTRFLLRSCSARLVAADAANRKTGKKLGEAGVFELARRLDARRGDARPCRTRREPKRDGTHRVVALFGTGAKALQELIGLAHAPQADVLDCQFAVLKNRGTHRAARAVKAYLEKNAAPEKTNLKKKAPEKMAKHRYNYVVLLDAKGNYDQWGHEGIRSLLVLPGAVIDNVVLNHHDEEFRGARPLLKSTTRTKKATARFYLRRRLPTHYGSPYGGCLMASHERGHSRRGIYQGSAASPLVNETLLAWAIRELPEGTPVVAYIDDIVVFTGTKGEARAVARTLLSAFERHPAGPIRLKTCEVVRVRDGFDFVGYNYSVGRGQVRVVPAPRNLEKFEDRLDDLCADIDEKLEDGENFERELETAYKYVESWAAAFSVSPPARAWALHSLDQYVDLL